MPIKLFVGKLAYSTSEKDLMDLFARAGTVVSVKIIIDKFSGQSRGFGFVEMESAQAGKTAIQQYNNFYLGGRTIVVNEARPQEPRSDNFGRGTGDFRRNTRSFGPRSRNR
jgi:RNA recognition motif-containing protein